MTARRATTLIVLVLTIALAAPSAGAYPVPGRTSRLSVSESGAEFDQVSGSPEISADGRWVILSSDAPLIASDANGIKDFYVKDLATGELELVSVASDGTQANAWVGTSSARGSISDDGRLVAFESVASNLAAGDTNGVEDVFVHDRQTGTTIRASVSATGAQGTAYSFAPQLSGDGRSVFFFSEDDTLVPGDRSPYIDIFRRDLQTGALELVTVDSNEQQSVFDPNSFAIDRTGSVVAWAAISPTNEVPDPNGPVADVYVRDLVAGTTKRISTAPGGAPTNMTSVDPSVSADGRYVAYGSLATNLVPGDRNRFVDIFVHDRQTGRTERVSVSPAGEESIYGGGSPSFSADGRFVAFNGPGPDLSSTPEGNSGTDAYVHDMVTGSTFPVSVTPEGTTGNDLGISPVLSADGSLAVFSSAASDLVSGDENGHTDAFLREVGPPLGIGAVGSGAGGVSGWARFAGVAVSGTDSAADGSVQVRTLGGEIVGARAVWRPELEDVFVRVDLGGLPHVPDSITGPSAPPVGVEGIHYNVSFKVGTVTYQVRIDPVRGERATPTLFRCAPTCAQIATLEGSLGDIGEAMTAAVPLALIGAQPGVVLTDVAALTSLNNGVANTSGDSLTLGSLPLAVPRVELGTAAPGAPASDVAFDRTAGLTEGRFSAPALEGAVWARACLGATCGPATLAG
ncbi:MAG TPA: hypothetical protein VGB51_03040 [Actinomycetota bacterium]